MQYCTSEDSFRNLLSRDTYDYRFEVGIAEPVKDIRFSEKNTLISGIAKHFVIHQVKAELDQILSGLSQTLNVLVHIKQHPNLFRPLFVFNEIKVTGDMLFDLFHPKLSPKGSNIHTKEEAAIIYWLDLLQNIQGD